MNLKYLDEVNKEFRIVIKTPEDCWMMNQILQKYNVEEDMTDLAPSSLSPVLPLF